MFIDEAVILARGGRGGDGCVSFKSEKFRPKGGPDGGDGGEGGSVYLRVKPGRSTLLEYTRKNVFRAENGVRGGSSSKKGRKGRDLFVDVPPGTVVRDEEGNILADLIKEGQELLVARGGRGGRGNASLTREAGPLPGFAEKGEPGEERKLKLELRLVADVAIVGMPNAGKSTLISRISGARPKIADYPFTTIEPHPGVVSGRELDFVVTDVPGLVSGAHLGKGMGFGFLKHISRAGVVVCLVDVSVHSGREPADDLSVLLDEIKLFDEDLPGKVRLVVGNKIDLPLESVSVKRLEDECARLGLEFLTISALRGDNIEELKERMERLVLESGRSPGQPGEEIRVYRPGAAPTTISVEKKGGRFIVRGDYVERIVLMTDWNSDEALAHLSGKLKRAGVEDALAEAGATGGVEVEIAGKLFEYYPDEET